MKAALFILALAGSTALRAQDKQLPITLSGEHFEKAAKNRTTALLCTAGAMLFSAGAMALDTDQQAPVFAASGLFFVVGVGFNISAIGHERKAGRIMQGK